MRRLYRPMGYGTRLEMGYRTAITIVIEPVGGYPHSTPPVSAARTRPRQSVLHRDRRPRLCGRCAMSRRDRLVPFAREAATTTLNWNRPGATSPAKFTAAATPPI